MRELARRHRLQLRWLSEAALKRLGAGAFLAVSQGNARRTAGIAHLSYRPPRQRGRRVDVALVGKGNAVDLGVVREDDEGGAEVPSATVGTQTRSSKSVARGASRARMPSVGAHW